MRSGDSPRVTPLRGFSPNAFQGFEGCDLECPLGEMKIIGPRAIAGHRRQTRTERLHSAGQRGMASTAPLRKHKTGGRRASELRLGSSSERERQKAGLGAPAGTGAPLETWPCGYGLRLAPKSRSARKSWLNANRHGKCDLPEKLETSTRPRALNGTRRHPSSVPPTLSAPAARNGARRTPQ